MSDIQRDVGHREFNSIKFPARNLQFSSRILLRDKSNVDFYKKVCTINLLFHKETA